MRIVTWVLIFVLLGFMTLTSALGQGDVTPPLLVSISVDTPVVDVRTGSATASLTAHMTDNISGVQPIAVVFRSPHGQQVKVQASPGLVSGTLRDGVFQGTGTVPQFAETGTWTAILISVCDNANHWDQRAHLYRTIRF
jgi:serine protease